MADDRKQKLVDLGPEALADALLDISDQYDVVHDKIDQLIATPQESIAHFKKKLSSLRRSSRFIGWKESSQFAHELEMLLHGLKSDVIDPMVGLQLIANFYKTDNAVFERCDDSSGQIGDVYRYDALSLFKKFAAQCVDKKIVMETILNLSLENDYGARDAIIDCASCCLSDPEIRTLIKTLQDKSSKESNEHQSRIIFLLIESLARQIKDAPLFEKIRKASWGELNSAACIDIARVYFESEDIEAAQAWLDKIPENDSFQAYERNKLLEDIYRKQGNDKKLIALLHHKLKSDYSIDNLEALLKIIGDDKRDQVILNAVNSILEAAKFSGSNMEFLINIGKIDEAEKYFFDRADQLNGDFYMTLLPLAKSMSQAKRPLAATLLYRSLLTSILERGYTKAYSHGIRYLKILDKLDSNIIEWNSFSNHKLFKSQLVSKHGRKKSFWVKYEVMLT